VAIGARAVRRTVVLLNGGDEVDLVRTESKHLAELAHLRNLRLPPSAFPEIDRLRLDAYGKRQIELRPPSVAAQRANRFHCSDPCHPHLNQPH
jgi:hypothetical protein